MSVKKIKIPGYAQKITYDNGIEYRPFTLDIVGPKITGDTNTSSLPVYSLGSFVMKTNVSENTTSKAYPTDKFTKFFSLDTINDDNTNIIDSSVNTSGVTKIKLNYDRSNLENFAYFGSLSEYFQTTLIDILNTWPASIFVKPISLTNRNIYYTVEDYSYDSINDVCLFKVNINRFSNNFGIKYVNGSGIDSLRNLSLYYNYYNIWNITGNTENRIIGFTGSTSLVNDYCYFKTSGNTFPEAISLSQSSYSSYHIKPIQTKYEDFFININDLGKYLLNRNTYPLYTSYFTVEEEDTDGTVTIKDKVATWPTSDGYNIDYDSTDYINYLQIFTAITDNYDSYNTNIINRQLVTTNIKEYDTEDGIIQTTMRCWGKIFDNVKIYADNISNVRCVTYDKKDNAPDQIIKNLAQTLGWETQNLVETGKYYNDSINRTLPIYSGTSMGYTAHDAEIELWRRLIINTPYLFKSKGTRKPITFFKKFFNIPDNLLVFNEHTYRAKNTVDVNSVIELNSDTNDDTTLLNVAVDENGYPKPLNNDEYYFQCGGEWYRRTGGDYLDKFKNNGNNPHSGGYDGGQKYWYQFTNLIPNFKPGVDESEKDITKTINYYTDYNLGTFDGFNNKIIESGATFNALFPIYYSGTVTSVISQIIDDPLNRYEETNCLCVTPKSLIISPTKLYGNDSLSSAFTRNNCGSGYSGTTIIYTVPENKYYSITKDNANNLAYNEINISGQTYANNNGSCILNIFYNTVQSGVAIKNDCGEGYSGSTVTYTVSAGTYSGLTQSSANQLAIDDVTNNKQTYANTHGTCVLTQLIFTISDIPNLNNDGGSQTVSFNTVPTGTISVVSKPSWISNVTFDNINKELTVTAIANTGQTRNGSIEFSCTNGAPNVTKAVKQVEPDSITVAFVDGTNNNGTSCFLTSWILGNNPYYKTWATGDSPVTYTINNSWITYTSEGYTTTQNGRYINLPNFTLAANTTGSQRTGSITFKKGTASATLTVTQPSQ